MMRVLYRGTLIFLLVLFIAYPLRTVSSKDLEGTNYKLKDVKITAGQDERSTANYRLLPGVGSQTDEVQLESSGYKLGLGHAHTLRANTPLVKCFETNTDSTSNCSQLPAGTGMVQVCGEGGCYDRARFEIDPQGNPTDTLYEILLTDDNWTTTYYLDGTTHTLETKATHDINDFKTKYEWEVMDGSVDWSKANILGLKPNTTYKIKVIAFHGNFTQSYPSPEREATTTIPILKFDLDVGLNDNVETSPPYALDFGELAPGLVAGTKEYLYMDLSTNAQGGARVYVKDIYNGLYNSTKNLTIPFVTADLASSTVDHGVGLKILAQSVAADGPGYIGANSKYVNSGVDEVGDVTTTLQVFICSTRNNGEACDNSYTPAPLLEGRVKAVLKAKPSSDDLTGSYQDTLSFYAIAAW